MTWQQPLSKTVFVELWTDSWREIGIKWLVMSNTNMSLVVKIVSRIFSIVLLQKNTPCPFNCSTNFELDVRFVLGAKCVEQLLLLPPRNYSKRSKSVTID